MKKKASSNLLSVEKSGIFRILKPVINLWGTPNINEPLEEEIVKIIL
jgi:hypothetical protein